MSAEAERFISSGSAICAFVTSLMVLYRTVRISSKVHAVAETSEKIEVLVNSRMSTALSKIAELEQRVLSLTNAQLSARAAGQPPPAPPPLPHLGVED